MGANFEFEEDSFANSIYEAFILEGATKLRTSSSQEDRVRFIKKKIRVSRFIEA